MEFEDEFDLSHLLFNERICRTCHVKKDLLTDFYLIRKNSKGLPSASSYECKQCTKRRLSHNRRKKYDIGNWQYPDW